MQAEQFSLDRQQLWLGEQILSRLYPDAEIRQDAGPGRPDLIVHDGYNAPVYYDMKYRNACYTDIAVEYGSLRDNGSWAMGWPFTHPNWNILYVLDDHRWYKWNSQDLLNALLSKSIPLTRHFSTRKGNAEYATLSFGLRPKTMGRLLQSFQEGPQ